MKKAIIIMALGIFSTAAVAQKARVGYKSGLNFSDVTTNDKTENEAIGPRTAYHLGLVFDIPMNEKLSFQPQLLYSGRGAKEDHDDHKDIIRFNSLEIPLNLVYRTAGSEKGRFFFGGGPNVGYNLNGKVVASDDPDETTDFEFGSAAGQIRRMDLGLNFLAGYETSRGFFVSANYNRGLTNWLNSDDSWRNHIFAVSIGWLLYNKQLKK
jgi:hypothetical protein